MNSFIEMGMTPLAKAAHRGQLDVVKKLVAEGADIFEDDLRDDPLHKPPHLCAAAAGHLNVALFLIAAGADANKEDGLKLTTLYYACQWNAEWSVISYLVRKMHNAAVAKYTKWGVLVTAVDEDRRLLTEYLLLICGCDPMNFNLDRMLYRAVEDGNFEATEFLLAHGADAVATHGTFTVLEAARGSGSLLITKCLMEHVEKLGPRQLLFLINSVLGNNLHQVVPNV